MSSIYGLSEIGGIQRRADGCRGVNRYVWV